MSMRRWAGTSLVSVVLAWVLWAHSFETVENHSAPGTWTPVIRTEHEAECEAKKAEQVRALLNALVKFGATVDASGDTVFYAARTADGRPIMTRTRYRCLPASQDPRELSP